MKKINVIAFGGLGGRLYSTGLKTILMRLDGVPGIDFRTFEDYTSWRRWGDTLTSWRDPTVLLGHSYGVAAMFGAVRRMGGKGPQIPLALSFDPSQWHWMSAGLWGSGGNAAPSRVAKVINWWQAGLPIGYQRVTREDGGLGGIQNHQVRGVAHHAIEDTPQLQAVAVDEIKRVVASVQ